MLYVYVVMMCFVKEIKLYGVVIVVGVLRFVVKIAVVKLSCLVQCTTLYIILHKHIILLYRSSAM